LNELEEQMQQLKVLLIVGTEIGDELATIEGEQD
jgi:hypothetical protein